MVWFTPVGAVDKDSSMEHNYALHSVVEIEGLVFPSGCADITIPHSVPTITAHIPTPVCRRTGILKSCWNSRRASSMGFPLISTYSNSDLRQEEDGWFTQPPII